MLLDTNNIEVMKTTREVIKCLTLPREPRVPRQNRFFMRRHSMFSDNTSNLRAWLEDPDRHLTSPTTFY